MNMFLFIRSSVMCALYNFSLPMSFHWRSFHPELIYIYIILLYATAVYICILCNYYLGVEISPEMRCHPLQKGSNGKGLQVMSAQTCCQLLLCLCRLVHCCGMRWVPLKHSVPLTTFCRGLKFAAAAKTQAVVCKGDMRLGTAHGFVLSARHPGLNGMGQTQSGLSYIATVRS